MGGSVPPAPLTKAAYASRLGVSAAAVSKLISRGKLCPPALRDDGKINPDIADRQLHSALNATASAAARNRQPRSRVPALVDTDGARAAAARKDAQDAQAAYARAALLAKLIGDVEDRFFPILIFELELSFQDAERLERAWYLFRRRVSRRVAEPEQN
jgi:hypothetical protein